MRRLLPLPMLLLLPALAQAADLVPTVFRLDGGLSTADISATLGGLKGRLQRTQQSCGCAAQMDVSVDAVGSVNTCLEQPASADPTRAFCTAVQATRFAATGQPSRLLLGFARPVITCDPAQPDCAPGHKLPTSGAGPAADQPRSKESVVHAFDIIGSRLNLTYQKLLRDNPDAGGRVTLTLGIAADGSVQSVGVQTSPDSRGYNNDFLESLKKVISGYNFGPAAAAGEFKQQINFLPGG